MCKAHSIMIFIVFFAQHNIYSKLDTNLFKKSDKGPHSCFIYLVHRSLRSSENTYLSELVTVSNMLPLILYLIQDQIFPLLLLESSMVLNCEVVGSDAYVERILLGPSL